MSDLSEYKFTFAGGVHPPENKAITEDCAICQGPVSKQLLIPLSQHIGAICEPKVKKGDIVKAGDVIGDCEAFVTAAIHSPINGVVKDISLGSHPVLGRVKSIRIEVDQENNQPRQPSVEFERAVDVSRYTPEQICEAVKKAGIVGMGGAGFPTRVKIEPNPRLPKKTLIINACECEPYITCDYRIMLEWTNQVIAGIQLAQKSSGCGEVFIGVEDNKPEAIRALREALEETEGADDYKVVALKTKYPQGGERQLIKAVTGKYVPTGSIPPMVGVVVLNVATAAAIAEAVVCGRPLTHRVVTVTGEAIAKPGNYYVPIGTSINDLIEFCGGVTEKSAKVLSGGPMMGIAIADLDTPITKTSGAVTILTKEDIGKAKYKKRQTPCIRCGRCLEACPENLNPTKIAHAVKYNRFDISESYYISACVECGCCSYVCPANIEITGHIKTGKIHLARQKKQMPQ
ncbi:MAG: electron transport complex subunit RsxC [Phycisphaerae bacterium]|nr:electron transport complex subunit RsxC [Phycisphaerae bacterium]